jgi:N-acetyl-beta-hexosaminidase
MDPEQETAVVENGKDVSFNFKVGRYEVVTEAGPSFTTKRIEAAEAMMQLTQAAPELFRYIGDLMVRNMDWPGAEEIANRLKKMLPPELQDAEEGESPEVAAVKAQAQQMIDQLVAQFEEAKAAAQQLSQENQALQQELKNKDAESAAKLQDADTREYESRTERIAAVAPAITPELIQQIAQATAEAVLTRVVETPTQPPPEPPAPLEPASAGFFTP